MNRKTKIRARLRNDGQTEVLVMIRHPMNTKKVSTTQGCQAGSFIRTLRFYRNDSLAAEAMLGPWVAANPLTGITLKNANTGDRIRVDWEDNQGNRGQEQVVLG